MSATSKRVFIVDDSPIVRGRLARLISDIPGATVVGEAASAMEAIEQIPRLSPNLVVMDISMPGGSGMCVLENLKHRASRPVIIMLTNFADAPYREKCRALGANYFFDKSSEFEEVSRVIRGFAPA